MANKAIIRNKITGETINVHATIDHPACSYNRPVWADDEGTAYLECGCKIPNPLYEVLQVELSENERIGQLLFDRRMQLGMSIQEAKERTGLYAKNIERIEKGTNNPTLDKLLKLCDVLGVRLIIEPKENSNG